MLNYVALHCCSKVGLGLLFNIQIIQHSNLKYIDSVHIVDDTRYKLTMCVHDAQTRHTPAYIHLCFYYANGCGYKSLSLMSQHCTNFFPSRMVGI